MIKDENNSRVDKNEIGKRLIASSQKVNQEDINKIVDIELSSLIERVNKLGYSLTISKKAKDFICEKGFDEKHGAPFGSDVTAK